MNLDSSNLFAAITDGAPGNDWSKNGLVVLLQKQFGNDKKN